MKVIDLPLNEPFSTNGTSIDIRIGKIRSDFNIDEHGNDLSFFNDLGLFETKDKEPIAGDTGTIILFNFSKPFRGSLISLIKYRTTDPDKINKLFKGTYRDIDDNFYRVIKEWLFEKITDSPNLSEAVSIILHTCLCSNFNQGGIQYILDSLKNEQLINHYVAALYSGEILHVDSNIFAEGILLEFNVFYKNPANVSIDGDVSYIGDDDLYRDEEKRFIVCLA